MTKEVRTLVIRIIIVLCILALIGIGIYSFVVIKKQSKVQLQDDVYTYLITEYNSSPILGLLNYNFKSLNSLNMEQLGKTNFLINSIMSDEEIDNIYKQKYKVTREEYKKASNYVSSKEGNCYYHQNVLKEKGFNCDAICSGSYGDIYNDIRKMLKWDNVLDEDVKGYCVKNPVYSIEETFIDLKKLESLWKKITGKTLNLDSSVTNGEYYKYNSYLTSIKSEETYIIKIMEVTSAIKDSDGYITATYNAKNSNSKLYSGTVILEENNDTFYIVGNNINTGYYLNN